MRYLYICMLFLYTTGCAHKMSKEAMAVRYLAKSDAPANCKEIGPVTGGNPLTLDIHSKRVLLREATAKVGGDTVAEDFHDNQTGVLYGIAFKCKS